MRQIFILVPAPVPSGPIKGAYALANALVETRPVTLVTLKPGGGANVDLDARVLRESLAEERGIARKIKAYREILERAGGRRGSASISMCLSADVVNLFCRQHAVTCASVRGNLLRNYRFDYGLAGLPLAIAHLTSLRGMDHVVAMTRPMARQISRFTHTDVAVIGNFVDEPSVDRYRSATRREGFLRFAFLGSLTPRKQPLLAIQAVAELQRRGVKVRLEIVGDGPLRIRAVREISRLRLDDSVSLRGFRADPYSLISTVDAMVLPSLSEGLSRACLEALHLGVPCVLRTADGNSEVVCPGINGVLFDRDEDLPDSMLQAAHLSRQTEGSRPSLLPDSCRQDAAARAYLELVESSR